MFYYDKFLLELVTLFPKALIHVLYVLFVVNKHRLVCSDVNYQQEFVLHPEPLQHIQEESCG